MAGDVSALGLDGGPLQSYALNTGVEKSPDSIRLLRASVPRQTKHRGLHRALLGAATAYLAIFALTFLIFVCARRLSNLSVARGRLRSLADAKGDEPAEACGGNVSGEDEDENYEEEQASQKAIIEQARRNMKGYKKILTKFVQLNSGASQKAVQSAASVYTLVISDLGALGAFVDNKLEELRSLWLEAMTEAVESAEQIFSGWPASHKSSAMANVYEANEDLVEFIGTIKTAKEQREAGAEGRDWAALHKLVQVQPVTIVIACRYLSTMHPESGATRKLRRLALSELDALSDLRRTMILAQPVFADYFKGIFSRGVARQRFGPSCGSRARAANPPLEPEDQISLLRERFPKEPRVPSPGTAATMRRSPLGATPSSKQKGPPEQPAPTPVQPSGPPIESQGPLMPRGHKGSELPSASYDGTDMKKMSGSALGSQPRPLHATSTVATAWHAGPRRRRRRRLDSTKAASKYVWSSEGEAPSEPWEEAEEGSAQGGHAPVHEVAQALGALALAEEEEMTAGVGGEVGAVHTSDDGPVHASQRMQALLPPQGQVRFAFSPRAAPGGPMGHYSPGVRLSSSPPANAFFGVAQGAPRLPLPRRPLPSESAGPPPRFAGRVRHILQRPSEPVGVSSGDSSMSPSLRPLPLASSAGPVSLILQRPAGPPGESHEAFARPPMSVHSLPFGFRGPPLSEGSVRQMLQKPLEPSGPLPSTRGGPFYASLLEAMRHSFAGGAPPPSPSMPFPSGPLSPLPPQPSVEGPLHVSSPVSSVRSPPLVSPSAPSVPGPLSALSAARSIWAPLSPSASMPFFSGAHPSPPSRTSISEPSFFGLSTHAVSEAPSSEPSPTQEGRKSRISGVFHGAPMGEPAPSGTSVTTAPPNQLKFISFLKHPHRLHVAVKRRLAESKPEFTLPSPDSSPAVEGSLRLSDGAAASWKR
ncbi:hypothetical protein Emag_005185 [Eimeria magna]